jgi:predicted CopG family antitoxin
MATKTLTITEDAYDRLVGLKANNESFSEVIKRILPKVDLRKFHGIISNEFADELEESIKEIRKEHKVLYEKRLQSLQNNFN